MSCCGGNCKCVKGSGGCGMCAELNYSEAAGAATESVVLGVAHEKTICEGMAAAENGCKCGSNCTCDPCNCK